MASRPRTLQKPTRRNILIEGDLWRRLMERAQKEERSASFLVRAALRKFLGLE